MRNGFFMYLCAIKLILKLQTTFKMKIKHLFLIVLLFVTGMVSAQQMGPIPVNKNVRQGKLSNGLTYYILHNEWPEHVANFLHCTACWFYSRERQPAWFGSLP